MFQRHTGCRPGEVVQFRLTDLDRSTPDVWLYRPRRHKTEYAGKERIIPVGPKAQEAIRSLMTSVMSIDAPLFSPQRAAAERAAQKRSKRKTPVQPSQIDRKKMQPKKHPGVQYDTQSYNKAVLYGIRRAMSAGVAVNPWHVKYKSTDDGSRTPL